MRIGVLVSGEGSNLQAILDAIGAGKLRANVAVVISNVASAGGLSRAEKAGIPTVVVDHRSYPSRDDFDRAIVDVLLEHEVTWVVLAGFMRVVTAALLDAFPMRVLNLHPSLLPAFPGRNAQAQAVKHGVRVSGCTVHFVDAGTDTGPILAQAIVPVFEDDDEDTLRDRIHAMEHALLPEVLRWIEGGDVTVEPTARPGERPRVRIRGASPILLSDAFATRA